MVITIVFKDSTSNLIAEASDYYADYDNNILIIENCKEKVKRIINLTNILYIKIKEL